MKCPKCGNMETRVLDSRGIQEGATIRRRRECDVCEYRFTTFERRGITDLVVVKRDSSREMYDRTKITRALVLAYAKRNIGIDKIDEIISTLELKWSAEGEVESSQIGQDILDALKHEDPVAYIRFASVYMNFDSLGDFQDLITPAG